jgi:hypothetical protein
MKSQLFLPQAGSTDTIASTTEEGWALRRADGHMLLFNQHGSLISDRDRFGNGFQIEYEPTPLFELYQRYCSAPTVEDRREVINSRRCSVLAYLLGDKAVPEADEEAWQVKLADYRLWIRDLLVSHRSIPAPQVFVLWHTIGNCIMLGPISYIYSA